MGGVRVLPAVVQDVRLADAVHGVPGHDRPPNARRCYASRWIGCAETSATAESMVGLLINTVPVRVTITAATTTADLLDQLQNAHNDILEHQHLALNEIHRVTRYERLFDTLFAFKNYPVGTVVLAGNHELTITEFTNRESSTACSQSKPRRGPNWACAPNTNTEVFDRASIKTLIGRLRRVLSAMTADPAARLSTIVVALSRGRGQFG